MKNISPSVVLALISLISSSHAKAQVQKSGLSDDALTLSPISDQSMNLASTITVPVQVSASSRQDVDLSVSSDDLADSLKNGDIVMSFDQTHLSLVPNQAQAAHLIIQTKFSAPDFSNKKFVVSVGSFSITASLTVDPILIIKVVNGVLSPNQPDPSQPAYDFKTVSGEAFPANAENNPIKIRPHSAGLQLVFENASTHKCSPDDCVIHGDGVVMHQSLQTFFEPEQVATSGPNKGKWVPSPGKDADGNVVNSSNPMLGYIAPVIAAFGDDLSQLPAPVVVSSSIYEPKLILPSDGANVSGDFTIHNVYYPFEYFTFNASGI